MNCLICRQAETIEGFTSILFVRGEIRLEVNSVPARVCPGCGEAYLYEDVAVRVLRGVTKISVTGTLEDEVEYGDLP